MVLACVTGILFLCIPYVTSADRIRDGRNDFAAFYASARLVSTPHLYDSDAGVLIRKEAANEHSPARDFVRLPYVAALLWPFGQMSYLRGYWAFQAVSLLALTASALLWPGKRTTMLIACCWSLPVSMVAAQGQDVFFLLLWITLALRWADRRPIAAGFVLSLCAAKFHLFFHIPILLAARREWRIASGMGLGGGILASISFAVAGIGWPGQFLGAIARPRISPAEDVMPNLHNLLAGAPGRVFWEPAIALGCGVLVWVIARRTNWRAGMAAALIAGLLTSVHSYLADCTLLIPALLVLIETGIPPLRLAGICLLSPAAYLPLIIGGGYGRILPAVLLTLLASIAYLVSRSEFQKHPNLAEVQQRDSG